MNTEHKLAVLQKFQSTVLSMLLTEAMASEKSEIDVSINQLRLTPLYQGQVILNQKVPTGFGYDNAYLYDLTYNQLTTLIKNNAKWEDLLKGSEGYAKANRYKKSSTVDAARELRIKELKAFKENIQRIIPEIERGVAELREKRFQDTGEKGDKIIEDIRLLKDLMHILEEHFIPNLDKLNSYYDRYSYYLAPVSPRPGDSRTEKELEIEQEIVVLRNKISKKFSEYSGIFPQFLTMIKDFIKKLDIADKERKVLRKENPLYTSTSLLIYRDKSQSEKVLESEIKLKDYEEYAEFFNFKGDQVLLSTDSNIREAQLFKLRDFITQVLEIEDKGNLIQLLQTNPQFKFSNRIIGEFLALPAEITPPEEEEKEIKQSKTEKPFTPSPKSEPLVPVGKKMRLKVNWKTGAQSSPDITLDQEREQEKLEREQEREQKAQEREQEKLEREQEREQKAQEREQKAQEREQEKLEREQEKLKPADRPKIVLKGIKFKS